MPEAMQIAVVGAGAWGTALAISAASRGHAVSLHVRDPDQLRAMQRERINTRYLPGADFPAGLVLLTVWRAQLRGEEDGPRLPVLAQAALYAAMPLFNAPAFLFLSAMLAACGSSAATPPRKPCTKPGVPAGVAGVPPTRLRAVPQPASATSAAPSSRGGRAARARRAAVSGRVAVLVMLASFVP
jgi:glycerol-3-phosphate dehydrogenase (NAD(P)+)